MAKKTLSMSLVVAMLATSNVPGVAVRGAWEDFWSRVRDQSDGRRRRRLRGKLPEAHGGTARSPEHHGRRDPPRGAARGHDP